VAKRNVVINILGIIKDAKSRGAKRWQVWRPTISLVSHPDFPVHRMELLYEPDYLRLGKKVMEDIKTVSPDTEVAMIETDWNDPWDLPRSMASCTNMPATILLTLRTKITI
jgi:transcriptional regulatory protein RtcR